MSRQNFSADGKLELGQEHVMDERQRKAEVQQRREAQWMREYFDFKPSGMLSHVLSACWRQVIAAKIDLWSYRNEKYLKYFESKGLL